MFTGIVEEMGIVETFSKTGNGAVLEINCKTILQDIKLGDSIAVNGVCQTVVGYNSTGFTVQVSDETLSITNLKNIKSGDKVNLERALTLNSRLGGHIVSGHVDCVGKLVNIKKLNDFYDLEFEIPQDKIKYIVHKGSITINGISLTVAKTIDNIVKIAIIPHTFQNTTLSQLKIGDGVNIETDILGKYVEKLLSPKNNSSNIDMKFLYENGFV